ncbi:unnamed protein product [Clonostachys chloroleuca]|uniref:Alpha/beta hydrolase fold-3 domain-containing protein n=1 Tax=Clonostachys chloroleuca TaxID=1926264 RepID=A0AA35MIN0_9HYPO|nr:unnamed protein product [Clonostachys chloroleuca]
MVVTKFKPEYAPLDPNFKPGPKNGHLSEIDADFLKMKPDIDAFVDQIWDPAHSLETFRSSWTSNSSPPPDWPKEGEDVVTETKQIPVRDGTQIEVKIYRAKQKKPGSALVMRFHGGGWVVGGHCTEHPENLVLAARTNSVVVSVAYRMAPEFKFPHAANDCLDALKWSTSNAELLGVNPEKILVNGGSAGANIASVVAIMARDDSVTGIVGQILTFPVTCHPKFFPKGKYELLSYQQNATASLVNPLRMEWFLDQYMPDPTDDWRLSPLLTPSLRGLPRALIIVGGYDIFRDEGLAYAERLKDEGVDTEVHVYPGLPHCFFMFPAHPKAVDYYEKIVEFVKKISDS